jgi:hypothetical protein
MPTNPVKVLSKKSFPGTCNALPPITNTTPEVVRNPAIGNTEFMGAKDEIKY